MSGLLDAVKAADKEAVERWEPDDDTVARAAVLAVADWLDGGGTGIGIGGMAAHILRDEVAPPTPTAEDVADNALLMYLGSEVEGAGKVIAAALRDAGMLR